MALAVLACSAPGRADEVYLKGGGQLSGKITSRTATTIEVEVGAGRLNIRAMLRALLDINYTGVVSFEYEKIAGNPIIGLSESVGYVRGVLAAFAKT